MGHSGSDQPLLVATKLRPPPVAESVVGRPRISAMLDAALVTSTSMVLVSAPAGAGKSTAIVTWLDERTDLEAVWLHVDARDNDPIRFWSALVAALEPAQAGIADQVLPVLRAPNTAFGDAALPVLVNLLDRDAGPLVIVIDDYHLISNADIHEGLQELVDLLPRRATVLISSRIDPPLRLGRLRVRGHLNEIRASDLAFDHSEAAVFFEPGALGPDEIGALCIRTEGWAAGLVLAAASRARSDDPAAFVAGFAGDNRDVVDYVATELIDRLPERTREAMIATSILDQMSGPLVSAIAQIDDGARWLEDTAQTNQLLIALDDQRRWYRYHHLLRDLLRQELERTRPTDIAELHRRAATWYAAQELNEDALRHTLASKDLTAAADLVSAEAQQVLLAGQLATLQGWLDALGPEVVQQHLGCAAFQMWTQVIAGRFDQAARWLETAERLLDVNGAPDEVASMIELVAGGGVITALANGNVGAALSAAERVVANANGRELSTVAADIVGDCQTWAGHAPEARALLEASARRAAVDGQHLIACTSRRDLAVVAVEEGDMGRAHDDARQVLEYAELHSLTAYHQIAVAHSVVGITSVGEGDDAARNHLNRGVELARRSNRPIMLAYALATRAQLASSNGRSDPARSDLTEARKVLARCPDPGMVLTFVARREAQLGMTDSPTPLQVRAGANDQLTPRELTVLRLLPSQLNVTEIADELYVSRNTVKGHVKAIYRKLGVNDRALAVQRARELRLL